MAKPYKPSREAIDAAIAAFGFDHLDICPKQARTDMKRAISAAVTVDDLEQRNTCEHGVSFDKHCSPCDKEYKESKYKSLMQRIIENPATLFLSKESPRP